MILHNPQLQCIVHPGAIPGITWFVEPNAELRHWLDLLPEPQGSTSPFPHGPFEVAAVQDQAAGGWHWLVYRRNHRTHLLERVFEGAPTGMALLSLTGQWLEVNPALCNMLGYSREELLSRTAQDITHPQDLDSDLAQATGLLSGEIHTHQMEKRCVRKDGRVIWIQLWGSVIRDPHGQPDVLMAHIQDISRQKAFEHHLQQAQGQLRSILDHMPAMVSHWDLQLHNQFANQAYLDWLGWDPAELLGQHLRDVLGEKAFARHLPMLQKALAGEVQQFDQHFLNPQGQLHHVQVCCVPDLQGGEVQGVFVLVFDVTRRVEAEHQLSEARQDLRSILDNMPAMIGYWDRDLRNRFANRAYVEWFGWTPERMKGRHIREVLGEDLFARNQPYMLRALAGEAQLFDRDIVDTTGQLRHSQASYIPDFRDGEVQGFFVLVSDVTPRKRAELALSEAQKVLRSVTDNVPAMIGYWDHTLHNRFSNRLYREFFNRPEGAEGKFIEEVIGPRLYQMQKERIARVLQGERQHFERLVQREGHPDTHLQFTYVPDISPQGEVRGFYVLVTDITELKNREQELYEQKEQARVTLQSIADGVVTTDHQGNVVFLNPAAESLTGWSSADAVGRPIEEVMVLKREHSRLEVVHPVRVALQENRPVEMVADAILVSRQGHDHPIEDSAAPIQNAKGEVLGAVLVFHPVGATRQLALQMSHLARHDQLTGLPNRMVLLDRLSQALAQSQRTGTPFAVLFLDLDQFKVINDTLGHHKGDLLLQQIARRLQSLLRATDTVSRQGGDEFVVLLTDVGSPGQVQDTAERILQEIRRPYPLEGQELVCTFSIGVALHPQDGSDAPTLLKHADAAMYQAKRLGRNGLHFFSRDIREALERQHHLQQALYQAVEKEEFEVHYQPKVNAQDHTVVGFEALVRWRRNGELVSPAEFIPVAEENGLMVPLGQQVLRQVMEHSLSWQQATGHPHQIAVNLSPRQFTDPHLLVTVRGLLDAFQMPPTCLEFEVTEGALMHDLNHVQGILQEMRRWGVKVSIDDFGTGFSSLSHLQAFAVDTLKIDRSFVKALTEGKAGQGIVRAVVSMARALDLAVIAEGVETEEQKALLLQLDCPVMQGYLFSRPMPADQVLQWLEGWKHR